jgi:hypothetical protein
MEDNSNTNNTNIKIKRVRKSKKQMLQEKNSIQNNSIENISNTDLVLELHLTNTINENIVVNENEQTEQTAEKVHKKRGRKPKGGKIIVDNVPTENVFIPKPNVIMHLKCGMADLVQSQFISAITYNPSIQTVETFQFGNEIGYDIIQSNDEKNVSDNNNNTYINNSIMMNNNSIMMNNINNNAIMNNINNNNSIISNNEQVENNEYNNNNLMNETISAKLKELTTNLHINNISYQKSACFWCTYDFDNPAIFIPKHEINEIYNCYGCFCSPECATAFLFKEHIDTSTRFERYHLINHIYCKIYGYTKNVKPAPDPFYLLNKYYGNLTIQEYRQLLKNERLLIIVDKPLSRTLPELHEDNDDFMFNGKTIPSSNKFKLKRKK